MLSNLLMPLCFLIAFFCKPIVSFSQAVANNKNFMYLEAGGYAGFGSVNYERLLSKKPGVGIRMGLGFYSEKGSYLTLPVGVNMLFDVKNKYNPSFIEVGFGISLFSLNGKVFAKKNDPTTDNYINVLPSVYYRQHLKKDIMWKIGIMPVVNKYTIIPWVGVAVGKIF